MAVAFITAAPALNAALAASRAAVANELGDYGAGQDSHVHGAATLQIVLEGSTLEVKLSSPAVNLLGFEGPANSAEKRASVAATRRTLEQPASLFLIPGAGCQLRAGGLSINGLPELHGDADHDADGHRDEGDHHDSGHHGEDHHDDDHHGEDHHDDDHHGEDHHDNDHHGEDHHDEDRHDKDHHDGEHHDDEHTDIVANYQYHCSKPDAAAAMNLPLLSEFPGIEKLNTQWVVSAKQGASTLVQGQQTLRFR